MSKTFKLINIGSKDCEVRLVKANDTQITYYGGIKPSKAVDDSTELSFSLGDNSNQYTHIVLGTVDTPNIKNPETYISNSTDFSVTNDNGQLVVMGSMSTGDYDPNYTEKKFGIFLFFKAVDGEYVSSTPSPAILIDHVTTGSTLVSRQSILDTKGVYFNDSNYYYPLFLGTISELRTILLNRGVTTGIIDAIWDKYPTPVKALVDPSIIVNKGLTSVTLSSTTTSLIVGNSTPLSLTLTPVDAAVTNISFTVSDPSIAQVQDINGEQHVVALGMGLVTVTAIVTDITGKEISSSLDFSVESDIAPMILTLNIQEPNTSFVLGDFLSSADDIVDWGDGTIDDSAGHSYSEVGPYTVRIYPDTGESNRVFSVEGNQLEAIVQWGDASISTVSIRNNSIFKGVPNSAPPGLKVLSFAGCTAFNDQNISSWDVSTITDFTDVFNGCTLFNRPLNAWNVSNGTSFIRMFAGATSFNQPLDMWNTSAGTAFSYMFNEAESFNQNINSWNVSKGMGFGSMFNGAAAFDQNLDAWDVSGADAFDYMFLGAKVFNGNISTWDVSKVRRFTGMFSGALKFNNDISNWDVSSATQMSTMFANAASFARDLRWWCVSGISSEPAGFATGSLLVDANKPRWGSCPNQLMTVTITPFADTSVNAGGVAAYTTDMETDVTGTVWSSSNPSVITIDSNTGEYVILSEGQATITLVLGGLYTATLPVTSNTALDPMIIKYVTTDTVKVANFWISDDNGFDRVDWGDGVIETNVGYGRHTHTYNTPGEYIARIWVNSGAVSTLDITGKAISEIISWGETNLSAVNLQGSENLISVPDHLPNNFTTPPKFINCTNFNSPNVITWDMSRYTDLVSMFQRCKAFNQDISTWDVSNVTSFGYMFNGASKFNQDISGWNVGQATGMDHMFNGATVFDRDLRMWCVTNITILPEGFGWSSGMSESRYPVWGTCPNRDTVVSIVSDSTSIGVGLRSKLTYTVSPEQEVTSAVWTSSDPTKLAVDSDGLLTGVALGGPVTITLTINGIFTAVESFTVVQRSFDAASMVMIGNGDPVTLSVGAYSGTAVIGWGDGTSTTVNNANHIDHLYTAADVYYIEVELPDISSIAIGGGITDVVQWTSHGYTSLTIGGLTARRGAALVNVPDTAPPQLTDWSYLFDSLPNFNSSAVVGWDTSSVTNMGGLFSNCATFNQDISGWDVSNVENMTSMLNGANAFKEDLSWWCVSKITSKPTGFGSGTQLTESEYPIWGTCPSKSYQLDITPVNPTLSIGESVELSYTLAPTDTIISATWLSTDTSVATVDANGLVTGVAVGTTYVYLDLNGKYSQSVEVTVVEPEDDPAKAVNLKIADLRAPTNIVGGLEI